MVPVVIIVDMILMLVILGISFYKLDAFENYQRLLMIFGGMLIFLIFTKIIYNISGKDIIYEIQAAKSYIERIMVILFSLVNSLAVLPMTFELINGVKYNEIKKDKCIGRVVILIGIVILLTIVEIKYFNYMQIRILNMAK